MVNKNRLFIIISVICLFCFLLLSKFEDRQIIRSIDFAATVKVQDKIDKSVHLRLAAFVDNIMEGSSFFASPEFTSIVVIFLTVLAFRKKQWRALYIPAAFLLILFVELYGKNVIHHPSPPFSMIKHTTSLFPANYINEQFSYPSGHVARAVFISIIAWIVFHKKKWFGVSMGLYVVLVAVSRIYLGHHWLSDVVGGALLGLSMGFSISAL